METSLSVAFQGLHGSFSSMAAETFFGAPLQPLHTDFFREIFEHVAGGKAAFGVVPLENALAGTVQENYDLLREFPLSIVGEVYLPIHLHLVSLPDPSGALRTTNEVIAGLKRVLSHPKALEQCSRFFEQNRHLVQVGASDTAGAAHEVKALGDYTVAAIASSQAAHIYGLRIVAEGIQNHTENITRFAVIARRHTPASVRCAPPNTSKVTDANPDRLSKCSVVITLAHREGSLHAALGALSALRYNLTKIESRPIMGQPFEYHFYIDITAPEAPEVLSASIEAALRPYSVNLRILGSYFCS